MEGPPTTTFFGKLAMTILGVFACVLTAAMMLPADRLDAKTPTAVLLVGVCAYVLAALLVVPLSALLQRLIR